MMNNGWSDGGWAVVWMILCLGVIIGLVWLVVRALTGGGGSREQPSDPKALLAQRFARGEIDAAEYHDRLHVLEETGAPSKKR
jgi:putative membrane protein